MEFMVHEMRFELRVSWLAALEYYSKPILQFFIKVLAPTFTVTLTFPKPANFLS